MTKYRIEEIKGDAWAKFMSEKAHYITFGEYRPSALERVDFSLVTFFDGEPIGYMQCKEMDSETVYFQMGGALPDFKSSIHVVPSCIATIDFCHQRYQRITTRIENTNYRMLKIALRLGFVITGVWNFKNRIYLELLNEKDS